MIDANALRNGIESEFNDEFDFEAFDNYLSMIAMQTTLNLVLLVWHLPMSR